MRAPALVLFALLAACNGGEDDPVDDTAQADTDTDTDVDSDTDSDTDTDVDSDTDTDTDTDAVDCAATYTVPSPGQNGLPACVVEELVCGDTVLGTTVGGTTDVTRADINAWFCFGSDPVDSNFDAPERRYLFSYPDDGTTASITLTSPCATLTMKAIRARECADENQTGVDCTDAAGASGATTQSLDTLFPGYQYEIIVDGLAGSSGNYQLAITCN